MLSALFLCSSGQGPVICSDGNNRDLIDHGDSGGPMLVKVGNGFKQLGIQVGQSTWSNGVTVQVFNRVSAYCDWIKK